MSSLKYLCLLLLVCLFLGLPIKGYAAINDNDECQRKLVKGINQEEATAFGDAFILVTKDLQLYYSHPDRVIESLPLRFRETAAQQLEISEQTRSAFTPPAANLLLKLIRLHGIEGNSGNQNLLESILNAIQRVPTLLDPANQIQIVFALVDPTGARLVPRLISWTRRTWLGLRPPNKFLAPRAVGLLAALGRLSVSASNSSSVSNEFVLQMAKGFREIFFENEEKKISLQQNLAKALLQRNLPASDLASE